MRRAVFLFLCVYLVNLIEPSTRQIFSECFLMILLLLLLMLLKKNGNLRLYVCHLVLPILWSPCLTKILGLTNLRSDLVLSAEWLIYSHPFVYLFISPNNLFNASIWIVQSMCWEPWETGKKNQLIRDEYTNCPYWLLLSNCFLSSNNFKRLANHCLFMFLS